MLGKFKKFFQVVYYYFTDSDNLLLHLMEIKAHEILKRCQKLSVRNTEELEDLIFHIKIYKEIPKVLLATRYSEFEGLFNIKSMLKKHKKKQLSPVELLLFEDYILDVEKQRAIERDFIFESAKVLSFGFEF